jgi:hypothetical protein
VRPGIPVGIPANVSQVVDRLALGKSCVKPTENESWPTLGADCRVKKYKLPCVLASTGWVERILTVKELLLAWDLPATTIKNAAENVGRPVEPRQNGAVQSTHACRRSRFDPWKAL